VTGLQLQPSQVQDFLAIEEFVGESDRFQLMCVRLRQHFHQRKAVASGIGRRQVLNLTWICAPLPCLPANNNPPPFPSQPICRPKNRPRWRFCFEALFPSPAPNYSATTEPKHNDRNNSRKPKIHSRAVGRYPRVYFRLSDTRERTFPRSRPTDRIVNENIHHAPLGCPTPPNRLCELNEACGARNPIRSPWRTWRGPTIRPCW
jgi:hypothetical protein